VEKWINSENVGVGVIFDPKILGKKSKNKNLKNKNLGAKI